MGACIKMFVLLSGWCNTGRYPGRDVLLTVTLLSTLKTISEHTSYLLGYLSNQYNTVVYLHSLNKEICIHSECRISVGYLRYR